MSTNTAAKGKEKQQAVFLEFDNSFSEALRVLITVNDGSHPQEVYLAKESLKAVARPVPGLRLLSRQRLVAASVPALSLLDSEQAQRLGTTDTFSPLQWLSGSQPTAYCYAGHQFGLFSGQLGDRTAVSLGQVRTAKGDLWELLYKGCGPTPFTRHGDGSVPLTSAIRELLTSEALFHMGIPTVRTGWVGVAANSQQECATSLHLAPSFMRFGNFEVCFKSDPVTGQGGPLQGHYVKVLPGLLDTCIQNSFPSIWSQHLGSTLMELPFREKRDMYTDFFIEVIRRTAVLAAAWASVGFCHGMLNTENMSILGLSMETGSSAFMGRYDPGFAPASADVKGRYSFSGQVGTCSYNCAVLGEALAGPALKRAADEILPISRTSRHLSMFNQEYTKVYTRLMRQKLGLHAVDDVKVEQLVNDLLQVMYETGADYSRTFRLLAQTPLPPPGSQSQGDSEQEDGGFLEGVLDNLASDEELLADTEPRVEEATVHMLRTLGSNNRDPSLLPPLGFTPQMLDLEAKKLTRRKLLKRRKPEERNAADRVAWEGWLRQYRTALHSEANTGADQQRRVAAMNAINPSFVLRESTIRHAAAIAKGGDFAEVRRLLKRLETPFSEEEDDGSQPMRD